MNNYFLLLAAIFVISIILNLLAKTGYLWKPILISVFGAGVVFTTLALLIKRLGVVSYDLSHFIGDDGAGIPYEIILSSFLFPYTGISIYNFLNKRYPAQTYEKYSLALSNVLMGLCIAMIFFAYSKWYPLIVFSVMLISLFLVEYKNKIRFMYRFYRAYLVSLIAFLLVSVPFHITNYIKYLEVHTVKFNLLYVPFESYFYFFSQVLISILLFEIFKKKYAAV
jgi:hypothetical protein